MLVPPNATKRLLEENSLAYTRQMNTAGVQYLTDRGIGKQTALYFQIGMVVDPLPGDDLFRGRLSIPYISPSGVVAVKYRALDNSEPKYLTSSGATMKRLYNTRVLLDPHLTVYLCEGELDTITAAQAGLPAVGIPGINQWEKRFARAFRNRRVVVLADGDDSGQGLGFAEKVMADVDSCGIVLFDGTDVNKFFVDYGKDKLLEKVGVV